MKFLDAQRLAESQEKQADTHENKMMGGGSQNKHRPSPSEPRSDSSVHDDATALAQSQGVDITTVTGTGPNGQILPRDVRKKAHDDAKARQAATSPDQSPSK